MWKALFMRLLVTSVLTDFQCSIILDSGGLERPFAKLLHTLMGDICTCRYCMMDYKLVVNSVCINCLWLCFASSLIYSLCEPSKYAC